MVEILEFSLKLLATFRGKKVGQLLSAADMSLATLSNEICSLPTEKPAPGEWKNYRFGHLSVPYV